VLLRAVDRDFGLCRVFCECVTERASLIKTLEVFEPKVVIYLI